MARILEELILYDQFTNTFTSYIRLGEKAAGVTSQTRKATEQFTQSQKEASAATNSMTNSLKNLVGGYLGLKGIQGLFNLSDTITATTARLDMMNDGLQTTSELNDMIWQSAQRARGSYASTAAFVAKLGTLAGDAFDSNQEIIAFAEQINKQMALSGTTTMEAQAAMLQLTQGLASGVLRGEELNSVLEQTPMIAQTIARYMGVNTGEMRELASEGAITAEVVKNAMLGAAEETNAAFEQMPMTWGQVWTSFQNIAIQALQPVLTGINFLANNIEIIGPLVLGLGAAFVVFQAAANWTRIATTATAAYHFAVNLLSIGLGVLTGNTAAASAAVFTFNSALLASPITWIVMGVVLLVAALYAGVAAFNKLTGSSVSATGIITGLVATAAGFVINVISAALNVILEVFALIWNAVAMVANFVANVFVDPIGAIVRLFAGLADTVLGVLEVIATAIDTVFGSNLSGAVSGWRSGLDNLVNEHFGSGITVMEKLDPGHFGRLNYSDMFQTGYNWSANLFSSGGAGSGNPYAYTPYDELAAQLGGIGESVKGIEKSVNMSDEDIKALVDIAERRYVNNINLTAQTPVINITGQNTGNTAADRQNLANTIRDILVEQVAAGSVISTARAY
jgi:tape measure domain-containing protein